MMTSVVGCLSDLQAWWLHSWEPDSASASETGRTHAHFVTCITLQGCPYGVTGPWPFLPEMAVPLSCGWGDGCSQLSPPDAQGSRLCLAYDRCLRFGTRSDRRREVLRSPHKRENLGASLPERFIYSSSHSSSLRKVPLGRKWQDKSFGLHYSEQMCGLWISHAHSSIYICHC